MTAAWKEKMIEVRSLRKKSAGMIYDRVRLSVEIYDDPGYRADAGEDAVSRLDAEVGDTCADFLSLRAAYEFYPDRQQWEGRKLQDVVAEVLEHERQRAADTDIKKTPRRATVAELDKLKAQNERLQVLNEELRAENNQLREEIGVLKHRMVHFEGAHVPA